MKRLITLTIIFSLLVSTSFAKSKLLTVAEESDFKSTASYTQVIDFISKLKSLHKNIRIEKIAKTTNGLDIPMMVIANPMPASYKEIKDDPRMVLYIQANIHAGEVEGKEATLMLARDLLNEMSPQVFDNLILLIVPVLNADGNDPILKENRGYQNGPENGVGVRYNGQQLDINRDGLKIETPELKGLLDNVFNSWDPTLTVDCHTTNGSFHEEPVTFTWMMNPNGDRRLINYMRDKMMPFVHEHLKNTFNIENCFYGEFTDRTKPAESEWVSYASAPRYLTNYIGLRNRFSILNENYVYADYKSRVMGCYYLLHSILDYATLHAKEMKKAVLIADKTSIERGKNPNVKDSFAIEYEGKATPEKITIKSIAAEYYITESGRRWYRETDKREIVTIPYIADYFPTKQIKFPYAYLITIKDEKLLNNLKNHGIKIEKLKENQSLKVEQYLYEDIKPEERINQGHYLNKIKGNYQTVEKEFEEGTYLIRTSQKLGSLIVYLLEPESEDSLLKWNFFDRFQRPQWGPNYYPYPVYKVISKTNIISE